jgi:hypothetical protein
MVLNRTIDKEILMAFRLPAIQQRAASPFSLFRRRDSLVFAAGKPSQAISLAGDFIAIDHGEAPIF